MPGDRARRPYRHGAAARHRAPPEAGEAGLVERRRCEDDRRAVETSLTPAGRALLETGRQRMAAALLTALEGGAVDEPERAVSTARDALNTLLNAMEAEAS